MEPIVRAARDLASSKHAIALTGAGISTESGIPDFRGPQGIWTKNPEAERRAYRGYDEFVADPERWWRHRLTGPGLLAGVESAQPNAGHLALAELESVGLLRAVITQNVDGLHEKAGSRRLLEYHGSVLKLRCVSCCARFPKEEFDLGRLLAENRLPPVCPRCEGILKTDSVMFGEPIPEDVARASQKEAKACDLMIICGTSAVVYPFADLPRMAKGRSHAWPDEGAGGKGIATIIEINAEPTPLTSEGTSDYLIQGKTGEILPRIVDEVNRLKLG